MKTHRRGIEARVALLLVSLVSTALLATSCSATSDDDGAGAGASGGSAGTGAGSGAGGTSATAGTGATSGGSGGSFAGTGGGTAATGGTGATCAGVMCGGACVNTQSDPANCGACGNACGVGLLCSLGACSNTCAAGLTACGAACADTMSNSANCGTCGNACGAGQTCSAGVCTGGGSGGAAGSGAGGTAGTGTAGTGTAGTGTAGTGTAGSGGGGTAPPGYWTFENWHGCAWTGVGTAGQSTITPQDFTAQGTSGPYCVSGTVGAEPEYQSVALLGFNVAEPTTASCNYKPVDVTADGPPSTTPVEGGIAINFSKQGADTGFTLRVQLQGPNGHKEGTVGEADRWCATITETQGKVFVPYSAFTPKCWEMTAALQGTPYANQPISAVVFLVPGAPTATPYDFCINGFGYGMTADDAPGDEMTGNQSGTVGGANNDDLDFDRVKIKVDGENYIIQNNNWGNPGGSDCILSYLNNSFTVTTANGSGSSAPASFPSIFIGANGNTANGTLATTSTDNLPRQVSQIASISSSFTYTEASGAYNAAYDIWFANAPPTAEYQDALNGFVMIWLHDPSGFQPIGSNQGAVTIAGESWNKWVGPRGGSGPNSNAPVVSFVNPQENNHSRKSSFVNKNIKEFIDAAAGNGISSSMYLTDVFAGFEIWNGGVGLKVNEFKAVVQ